MTADMLKRQRQALDQYDRQMVHTPLPVGTTRIEVNPYICRAWLTALAEAWTQDGAYDHEALGQATDRWNNDDDGTVSDAFHRMCPVGDRRRQGYKADGPLQGRREPDQILGGRRRTYGRRLLERLRTMMEAN